MDNVGDFVPFAYFLDPWQVKKIKWKLIQTLVWLCLNIPHGCVYIALTQNGQTWQRNSTTCRSTGSFQVKAGDACQKGDPGIFLDAVSGDIIIKAASGKIRMSAQNIEMVADGKDGKNGIIKMKTNEKIILDAGQMVDIKCPVSVKIFSAVSLFLSRYKIQSAKKN